LVIFYLFSPEKIARKSLKAAQKLINKCTAQKQLWQGKGQFSQAVLFLSVFKFFFKTL
jgi:hypothetical protein